MSLIIPPQEGSDDPVSYTTTLAPRYSIQEDGSLATLPGTGPRVLSPFDFGDGDPNLERLARQTMIRVNPIPVDDTGAGPGFDLDALLDRWPLIVAGVVVLLVVVWVLDS